MGNMPLSLAIKHSAGWNVIDALTIPSDSLQGLDENTALQLVTSAPLAILRKAPEAATIHNDHGVLPIYVNELCDSVFMLLVIFSYNYCRCRIPACRAFPAK
jgi:hypothetical protein